MVCAFILSCTLQEGRASWTGNLKIAVPRATQPQPDRNVFLNKAAKNPRGLVSLKSRAMLRKESEENVPFSLHADKECRWIRQRETGDCWPTTICRVNSPENLSATLWSCTNWRVNLYVPLICALLWICDITQKRCETEYSRNADRNPGEYPNHKTT